MGGRRGGMAVGGGGVGIVGVLVFLVVSALGGGGGSLGGADFGQIQSGTGLGTGETQEELSTRCNAEGAIEAHDDCFLIKVYNETNEVWAAEFAARGATYREPYLGFFDDAVQTGCGQASAAVGPFYCPADEEVFFDLGFLRELQARFGAEGRPAQAYIMAHEVGHHLQTLLGTSQQVREAQQQDPEAANDYSVALELQADCYAGVWSRMAEDAGNISITESEVAQAVAAAEAVGDDRIQEATQGRVDPESWTHGSAEQRSEWFRTGLRSGDMDRCDTFSASGAPRP